MSPHRIDSAHRDGLVLDVRDDGPLDGPTVVLLHGFPEPGTTWDGVVPLLVEAGHRVLVPDQRGYSPRARPRGRGAYRLDELVADVLAVADAAGVERFHLVGHDWGGAVAWHLATTDPARLASLTVLSTPHPRALAEALVRSPQALRLGYVGFFQLPVLPEVVLGAFGGRLLERALLASGAPAEAARTSRLTVARPGGASGAIGWYRGLLAPGRPSLPGGRVTVPTTYVWSTGDPALGRVAAERTGRWVDGPYRFEVLDRVSHWIPQEVPERVAELILEQAGDPRSACRS